MGGIHPRPKREVGVRLARAARNLIYGDITVSYTGPVVTGCSVKGGSVQLTFDPAHLKGDAVAVRRPAQQAPFPLELLAAASSGAQALPAILQLAAGVYGTKTDFLYSSPLEVQYGGSNLTDGVWLPAHLTPKCSDGGRKDAPGGNSTGHKACGVNVTTNVPLPGFNVASATLPLGIFNADNVTAIRYAFRDDPCCPGINRGVLPCPPVSCPLMSYNATLPAVPFVAKIAKGNCTWMSITP